jgi:hypothetical protein
MKRIALIGLTIIAVFAMAAAASGRIMVLELYTDAGPLAPGADIHAFSSSFSFTTSSGEVECPKSDLSGTLANNESTKDKGNIAAASFGGGIENLCQGTFGLAAIAAEHTPWPIEFTNKGAAALKSVAFKATFFALGDAHCYYAARKVKGKIPLSGSVRITIERQVFKLTKESAEPCPKRAIVSGAFQLTSTSDEEELELHVRVKPGPK